MEDSSFQCKVKCFLGKPPAVLFGSADQLSSEVLIFPFACFTWEMFFCEGFSSSEMCSLFLGVGNEGSSAASRRGRKASQRGNTFSCRLIHIYVAGPDQLEAQRNKNPCLCVCS